LMKPATDNAGNPVSSPGSIRPMAAPGNEETAVVTYSTVGSSAKAADHVRLSIGLNGRFR